MMTKALAEVETLEGYRIGSVEFIPADPNGGWHPFTSDSHLAYERDDREHDRGMRFETWNAAVRHLLIRAKLDPNTPAG